MILAKYEGRKENSCERTENTINFFSFSSLKKYLFWWTCGKEMRKNILFFFVIFYRIDIESLLPFSFYSFIYVLSHGEIPNNFSFSPLSICL
jgi:hypothetical protein